MHLHPHPPNLFLRLPRHRLRPPHPRAITTEHLCPVYFCPIPEQIWYNGAGFTHHNLKAPLAEGEVYPVRVLPFPCFAHAQTCRNWISPEEVKRKRKDYMEGRRDDERAVADVNVRILRSNKRRRGEFVGGDKGRVMRGKAGFWAPVGIDGKVKRSLKDEKERRRFWVDRLEAAREDCDARWREEERGVDLERLAGRRLSVRYAWPGEDGYAWGAVEDNATALRIAWDRTWGKGNAAALLMRADATDTGLVM
ncbi:hypothetical protein B0T14DRAFT_571179 [Immersiella caudata]|uniref:Uncharacterized protein n=1 Tax=Immersiella caudata TaxID=314043 RepID=A0AA39TL21_9PEZI|nr:hypothetical protein B0T14DRAFT_571179 [Immersiella caudata]